MWFPADNCGGGDCVPSGWVSRKHPWGAAPRGPRLPGGGPHFSREMGRKRAGAAPLDPQLYSPLAAARSFWGSLSLIRQRGCFLRYAKTDLGRIFREKICWKAFCERKFPNQGTYMGPVIAHRPEQCGTTAKTSECQRAGPKKRGGGGPPPATLCVRAFSRESLDPPPGTGREPTSQVLTCAGPNPDHLPTANPGPRPHLRGPETPVPTEPPTDSRGPRKGPPPYASP